MSGSEDDDQVGIPAFEGFSESLIHNSDVPGKRKREDGLQVDTQKSKKRRKSKKPKDVDDAALDVELGVNHAIAHMDSRLLADHIAQRTKKFNPELSVVEIEDTYIPGMKRSLESAGELALTKHYRESYS